MDPIKNKAYLRYAGLYYEQLRLYAIHRKVLDLPSDEGNVLWLIWNTHQCTQKDLCNLLGLPKQTVNNVIKRFAKEGWIEFRPIESDRRKKELRLTDKGFERTEAIMRAEIEAENKALMALPKEKRAAFLDIWEEFLKNLEDAFGVPPQE